MTDFNPVDQMSPDRLANLRASLYAGRSVASRDVRMLLDAYDGLRREMAAVQEGQMTPSYAG